MEFLRKSGVFVRLFEVNEKDMESIRSREDIFVFGENDKKFHIAQISLGAEALGFPEFAIPKREPKTLQDAILKTKNVILETKKELAQLATHKALLQDALNERIRRFDVRNVQFSGIVEEKAFRYWEGYVPVDSVDSVKELAEENNWGYCFEDPTGAELKKVPTKLKRNKLSSSVDILLEKAVPGYTERDYSSVFLFFYAVFAAMLIGDGGYGLLVLLVTLFFHRKNNWHAKEGHLLGYLLGGFIVSWGAITGTWFGYGEFSGLPILRNLVIPEMSSFQTGKNELALDSILFMMRFSFLIGAIQLSVGRLLSAYKAFQEKSWSALSDIGWVINTWAMFIVIKVLFTPSEGGLEFPSFMKYFFYVGIACAVLSQILQHGILKGILGSLGDLWGGFQGAFQDLLSYVRLQAVGFVTVVMGFVFNFLAELSGNIIAGILIVLIGHSLNMALAYLGFIVHGSRLNLNEMGSKLNAGLQGRRYRPFTLNIN